MRSTIALLTFTLALALFGCLDNSEPDSLDQDSPATTSASSVVVAGETQPSQLATELGAQPDSEVIVWRCPGSNINYSLQAHCNSSCSVACHANLVCRDSRGAPILCM
jgi:hypothetical protein